MRTRIDKGTTFRSGQKYYTKLNYINSVAVNTTADKHILVNIVVDNERIDGIKVSYADGFVISTIDKEVTDYAYFEAIYDDEKIKNVTTRVTFSGE